MARPLRSFVRGGHYHVTARGNDARAIFVDDVDRAAFMSRLGQTASRFGIDLHAWCLMTNHYHLVVALRRDGFSGAMQYLNSGYSRRYNIRHGCRGHLFEARFRAAVLVDEDHLSNAIAYVLENPVRAGLTGSAAAWPWAGAVGVAA